MINSPPPTPIEIALTLWEIGLVSEPAIVNWADAQILALEHPSIELIELSTSGVKLCLNRNLIDSRSTKLTFVEQFSLQAHLLDLACDRSIEDFIIWISLNCAGEDSEHPEVQLA